MNTIYINNTQKDYILSKRLHLGIEAVRNNSLPSWEGKIVDFNLLLRIGMKNFLPTFGVGMEIMNFIRLDYAFTNSLPDSISNEKIKLINLFSFDVRLNSIFVRQITEKNK